MMFVKVNKMAAQGDLVIRRIEAIPDNAKKQKAQSLVILAHSETGHHHAVANPDMQSVWLYSTPNALVSILEVKSKKADIVHHRDYDTHKTLRLDKGIYEIRRQEEWTPAGWKRVED